MHFHHRQKKRNDDDPMVIAWSHQCDIQKLANLMEDMVAPQDVQSDISALLAFAMSLDAGNMMREFREDLRLALSARLVWARRRPRQRDLDRNSFVVNLCIRGSGRTGAMRRVVILSLFNGRWDCTDVVEHNCPSERCCASKEACLQTVGWVWTADLSAPSLDRRSGERRMASVDGEHPWVADSYLQALVV